MDLLLFTQNVFFPLSLRRLLPDLTVYMSSTEGVLQEVGTVYPSREPDFTPAYFCWVRTAHLFSFYCVLLLFTF